MTKRIEKNHWFISDNKLNISLIDRCVEIYPFYDDYFIRWSLTITKDLEVIESKVFSSLEESINYIEDELYKEKPKIKLRKKKN